MIKILTLIFILITLHSPCFAFSEYINPPAQETLNTLTTSSMRLSSNSYLFSTSQNNLEVINIKPLINDVQNNRLLHLYSSTNGVDEQNFITDKPPISGGSQRLPADKNYPLQLAQSDAENISHQALATAVQDKDFFYFVKTGGAVPLQDESFRDFIDYGVYASFGAGKHMNENLSLSISLDFQMLTGDWSISGDRKSIEIAAEEWAAGVVNNIPTNGITPEAEELPDTSLGTSYHSEAEAVITSSESLREIDIHTDMYIIPVSMNALYRFNKIGKLTPYIGGGLGYCLAIRDSDSKAIKNSYFNGPEYKITMNNSQNRTGILLDLMGGFNVPVYKNLSFVAEGNFTYYDLDTFDPILEISIKRPANPPSLQSADITTYSYEDPKRFGVFSQEIVGSFSIGLVMPF